MVSASLNRFASASPTRGQHSFRFRLIVAGLWRRQQSYRPGLLANAAAQQSGVRVSNSPSLFVLKMP